MIGRIVQQKPRICKIFKSFSSLLEVCPFATLKITRSSSYKDAKKAFLQIAMANHPDTLGNDATEEQKEKSTQKFQSARLAIESLVEDEESGLCILRSEVEDLEEITMSDQEFE